MPVISFDVTPEEAQRLEAVHDDRLPARAGDTTAQKVERVGKYAKKCLFDVLRADYVARGTTDVEAAVAADYPEQADFQDIA